VCTTHYIHEDFLCEAVLTDLRQYAVLATTEREKLTNYLIAQLRKSQNSDENAVSTQINAFESRLLEIKAEIKSLYRDKMAGKLDEEILSELMDDCIKERAEIENNLSRLRRELVSIQGTASDISEWLDLIIGCLEIRTLDREIITGLVEKIVVGEKVRVKGQPTTQEIAVNYRFIGDLLNPRNAKEDAASSANVLDGLAIV
jgi:hypothetical protein